MNKPGVVKYHFKEILVASLFLLTYVPTLLWMKDRWFSRNSYYSHGILIPFVVAYLIWMKRSRLKRLAYEESKWGGALIIFGIFIHLVSSLFQIYFSSGFSMIIVLMGLVLFLYGKQHFRLIAFPLAFLIFMVPIPLVVIVNISFRMKLLAAHIAAVLLNHMRIPAIQEGSIIRMEHAFVIVDDVCSGLRSLISLMALGTIFAYWMKARFLKRIIVFLSSIPIAIVTNVCRIIFLSAVSEIWGPRYATGFLHDFSGFMVFALAFLLLWGVVQIVE